MNFTNDFLQKTVRVAQEIDAADVEKMVAILAEVRSNGGRVFFVGSGGGAGHASHATCAWSQHADLCWFFSRFAKLEKNKK